MNEAAATIRARYVEDEEYYVAAWRKNPKRVRFGLIFLLIIAGVLVLGTPGLIRDYRSGHPRWWYSHAVYAVFFPVVWFLMGSGAQERRVRRAARKMMITGPTEGFFDFSDAGFLSTSHGGRAVFNPWSTMNSACRVADGLFLYGDEQGWAYFWVPDAAFSSESEREAVHTIVRQKVTRLTDRTKGAPVVNS